MNHSRSTAGRPAKQDEQAQTLELPPNIQALRHLMPKTGTRKLKKHLGDMSPGRDRLFEILRQQGLLVKGRRKYSITTSSNHLLPVYARLLPQNVVSGPNQAWVADQTCLRFKSGSCCLSLLTDLYSRKIVGYDVHPTVQATGPLNALQMALSEAPTVEELIHHSDRRSQYCSSDYIEMLTNNNIRISMTERRRPDQKAAAESLNGILKSEFDLDTTFSSLEEAIRAVGRYTHIYNNIRLHVSLGLVTPRVQHAAYTTPVNVYQDDTVLPDSRDSHLGCCGMDVRLLSSRSISRRQEDRQGSDFESLLRHLWHAGRHRARFVGHALRRHRPLPSHRTTASSSEEVRQEERGARGTQGESGHRRSHADHNTPIPQTTCTRVK